MHQNLSYLVSKHSENQLRVVTFIKSTWPKSTSEKEPRDMDTSITYVVLTSLDTTVLLLRKGCDTMFSGGNYSACPLNPWHIHQDGIANKGLAEYIQECWDGMQVIPEDDRSEVNKLAPHILYTWTGDGWQQVPLRDGSVRNKTVRFIVGSIEMWSQPPTDEALVNSQDEASKYKYVLENLQKSIGKFHTEWDNRPMSNRIMCSELGKSRKDVASCLDDFYECCENFPNGSDSYNFPTLQLTLIDRSSFGVSSQLVRYGGNLTGVPNRNNNIILEMYNTECGRPWPLAQKKDLLKELLDEMVSENQDLQSAADELLYDTFSSLDSPFIEDAW